MAEYLTKLANNTLPAGPPLDVGRQHRGFGISLIWYWDSFLGLISIFI